MNCACPQRSSDGFEEVKPEYWHTVVMGRSNNPLTIMQPLTGLYGPDQAWNHYLVNEYN